MINATMISAPHILHYTISTRLGCPATELFNKTAPHLNLVRACLRAIMLMMDAPDKKKTWYLCACACACVCVK